MATASRKGSWESGEKYVLAKAIIIYYLMLEEEMGDWVGEEQSPSHITPPPLCLLH